MKKIQIKIKGAKLVENKVQTQDIVIMGDVASQNISEHDLAAVLFACEFAINNHASEMLGYSIRCHISNV